ncbi:glycerophosphodiester phosphodiesterase family protein [Corynebacterium sp. ES2794-CONJ1]|uniref:glycerophosphodiester phosphodiesterase family protein n=1 Tax=unclassified Corynebacterium TaxID=2624378 RepID=UPI00216A29C5|nr:MULTISPECIES: glycerophosphodiester phosphodiesterase family protein [unclassified Corynebacterium]MCS4490174.1 glycerophosphodiester phosphodiesterase [Corynebacterium sp. ES2775-CONJ]MCS4492014.1 glycerophosphodiester phosphodiesterase [Corynebacterium sp. ES2715-CONJ3]MCS4532119.1 glycerophosphodiester phosphodiesterase [Corynebacterium sp. ES2730-CONJ]MCU9519521.1 glycerophosphodiester phosphodiesterase family protein [Corynebacterium sp. ES2794-CONJ1]
MNTYPLPSFDFQAHRGGRGEWTEESYLAFSRALELGVSTLELDIVLTRDRVPACWHDPVLLAEKCDTRVGENVYDLSFEELKRVPCGKLLPDFPQAEVARDNRILSLAEVFDLAASYDVHFNIETKIEADKPHLSAEPEEFVSAILDTVQAFGLVEKVMIQSFDWRTFPLVRAYDPKIPLVALWDETTWFEGTPWGPFEEDIIAAALKNGISVLSPQYSLVDSALIEKAHDAGLTVVPWTVNDEADLQAQLDLGVDGLITDYPSRLKTLLDARGISY